MEQKTINKNKLITILCIIAFTLGVLVSAVLFSMPPVHAEENTSFSHTYTLVTETKTSNSSNYTSREDIYSTDLQFVLVGSNIFTEEKKIYNLYAYIKNDRFPDGTISIINDSLFSGLFDWDVTHYKNGEATYTFHNDKNQLWFSYIDSTETDNTGVTVTRTIDTSVPMFDTYDHALAYCRNGDEDGWLNKPETPNTVDESYTFTGFSINGKTARWTGTTERSYLKDRDVEEYTTITYAWATTTEPDNIGSFQEYNGEFPTSAKQLKLPWSDMESGKVDFQFIRQVNITPCYRVPGAFYHGQAVKIFFKPNGTVDKIEQATIPSDSETIGNDISLIGFRYDNSFHAEWVDIWSNGANKSAFDLSGSQYLSLGIKAVYYDGSKIDIDFFPLDRKNLTWDKTFSDFKENNGSPIKSLYFTPYTKTGVNNPWNKGNSTVVNFDENGNPSSSFDTGDDGTVHLNDFKLTGVVWNKPVVQSGTITWTGTTPNSDLLFIPDSDTLVVATYPRYDSDMNTSYETWSTTTIGKGSMKVNVDYLIDYYKNSELAWNGEMWLTPCYKKGGVLYMGEPVIINCLKGTVSDIVVDKDSGKAEQVDKTDQNKSDADSILNVGNQFYSIINGLIGSLQQLPALLTAIFGFLPSSIINLIYASFAVIIICRILGR